MRDAPVVNDYEAMFESRSTGVVSLAGFLVPFSLVCVCHSWHPVAVSLQRHALWKNKQYLCLKDMHNSRYPQVSLVT